jgi:hypothetical protein
MLKPLLTGLSCFLAICTMAQTIGNTDGVSVPASALTPFTSSRISDLKVRPEGFTRVVISWQPVDSSSDYFVIERSVNLQAFETVAVLHWVRSEKRMEWQDENPRQGTAIYRIKAILKDGSQQLAGITSTVQRGSSAEFKIYPNPAQEVLFIRADFPSDITFLDANGKTRMTMANITGLHLVNLQTLEKGVYLVRVFNRTLSTLSIERIIKN